MVLLGILIFLLTLRPLNFNLVLTNLKCDIVITTDAPSIKIWADINI